ncbi:ferrous iron transport protein A [Desulfonema ishimotonii]|uniref:Ferrous iron transport protein A n=1 Tax=Desulfonema ishimotonii TaxID=45657 RepID=A0A401G2N5_9BACT|nr:ferrous iron transport protein A [Desulfonema ishimotonii]GBC63512.1 ferrous iron transport protein A [Desulfonema ishimotonii]
MYQMLSEAPIDKPLLLVRTDDPGLADRLRRMGLSAESRFVRMAEDIMLRTVRIRGPQNDAVIGAGMAGKIVVHLNDGRKLPLAEMKPGESGHIEGSTCGAALQRTLKTLGFGVDDRVTFLRTLPPMEYTVLIRDDARRVRVPEGMAFKIWGESGGKSLQFSMTPTGQPFLVKEILGGKKARQGVLSYGIEPGKTLIPETVSPGQNLYIGQKNLIIISTTDGLRLFLEECQARRMWVRVCESS